MLLIALVTDVVYIIVVYGGFHHKLYNSILIKCILIKTALYISQK